MKYLSLLAVLLLFGCNSPNQNEKNPSNNEIAAKGAHTDNQWPKNYTRLNLPQYNKGKIVSSEKKPGDMKTEEIIIIDTNEKPPQIKAFFHQKMIDLGWKEVDYGPSLDGLSEEDIYAVMFTKGAARIVINAKRTPSVSSRIYISLSDYFDNK